MFDAVVRHLNALDPAPDLVIVPGDIADHGTPAEYGYGTFDVLHSGHLNLLRRARALGDHLTVAVSTDEFNASKNKRSLLPFDERLSIVGALKYVDDVIPESSWEQKINDIMERKIEVFTIGDDWTGRFDFLAAHCEVLYLPRTPDISSTMIRNRNTLVNASVTLLTGQANEQLSRQ